MSEITTKGLAHPNFGWLAKSCVAPGCTNHNKMGKEIKFHMFPCAKDRRSKWIQACK